MNFYSNCSTYARVLSLSLFTLGLSLASTPADAGEKVDRTLDTGSSPKLDIEHVNGKADIQVWDNQQVKVVGELSDRTNEFIFERKGNVVIIHVEVNRLGKKWWENRDAWRPPRQCRCHHPAVGRALQHQGHPRRAAAPVRQRHRC